MNEKVAEAIETLRIELGLATLSVWAPPGNEDADVEALFLAKDEEALMAAAVDCVSGGKAPS